MYDILRTMSLLIMHLIFFPFGGEVHQELEIARSEQVLLKKCKAEAPRGSSFVVLAKNKDDIYFAIYLFKTNLPPLHIKMGNINRLEDMPRREMNDEINGGVRALSAMVEVPMKDNLDFSEANYIYYHNNEGVELVALRNHSFENEMRGAGGPKAPKENLLEIIK